MRILVFSWRDIKNPKAGGAEVLTHELAKRWVKLGHQVTVFSSKPKGSVAKEIFEGIRFVRYGGAFSCLFWGFFYYQKDFQGKFDLIIDQVHGLPFFAKLYAKEKIVAFPLEVAQEIWHYEFPFPLSSLGQTLEKFYLHLYRNSVFITISPSTASDLKACGVKNVFIVPVGISLKPVSNVPQKAPFPQIISLGRITRMKRIEHSLEAFKIVSKNFPQAKLVICGRGDKDYLKKLIRETKKLKIEKKVEFLGFISEKEKINLLKKSWVLISTSVREGWGIVVTEAAACGTPAVVYKVPGLIDSVKDQKTGLICQKNSPEELAKNINWLLGTYRLRLRLSTAALSYSRQFTWDKSAKVSMDILKKIISSPQSDKS